MGNWTTVNMIGTCSKDDLPKLKEEIDIGRDNWDKFNCLSFTGASICGLGNWPAETINATGNLAERDYSTDDIAETLTALVNICPSLLLKVHVGGDYESKDCVATIICENGEVTVNAPEVPVIAEISSAQMQGNLLSAIMGG